MRVDIPEGKDPITWVWGEAVPGIGPAAARFSAAVYDKSTLSLREFEAARTRIAQINECLFCLDWRTTRDDQQVDESFYSAVQGWASSPELSERERLAAGYAEKFAASHLALDDDGDFWARMHAAYTDPQIIELTMCVGSWIAFGRLNHVLGIDAVCKLPAH